MSTSFRSASQGSAGSQGLAFAALILANVALATGPWLVRLADSGPVATAFWRLTLALPILLFFAWRSSPTALRGHDRLIGLVAVGGALFAGDLASWHLGILRTKLANATLFGNSTSLILPIVAIFVTGIWPSRMQWVALAIAFGGALLLMGGSFEASGKHVAGDLLCVLAGIFYAGYLLLMQSARRALPSWWLLALSTAASVPLALAMALALGEQVIPGDWTPVIGVALLSQVIGQGLLIYSLAHFTPLVVGLALLVQPVVAAIIGWIAFDERLSTTDFIGAAIIAAALILIRLPAGAARDEPLEERS